MIQRKIKKVRNLIGGLMWIPNWNTNLPAGLFSVVSSLNEYICFIIVTKVWIFFKNQVSRLTVSLRRDLSLTVIFVTESREIIIL